jgi:hypothetical protein
LGFRAKEVKEVKEALLFLKKKNRAAGAAKRPGAL